MNRFYLLLAALLFFVPAGVPAQNKDPLMLHFGIEDGLPSNTVYQVYRDTKGFMWFGTDKGIARYNGIRFETFTTFDGLADNEIFEFQEDHLGRLWMATYNGDLCYYKDGVFHTAENTPFLKMPFRTSHTIDILLEDDGSVTFSFYNLSRILNIKKERVQIIDLNTATGTDEGPTQYRRKINDSTYSVAVRVPKKLMSLRTFTSSGQQISERDLNVEKVPGYFGLNILHCQDEYYVQSYDYIFNKDLKIVQRVAAGFRNSNVLHGIYSDGGNIFWATQKGLIINDTIHILENEDVSSVTGDKYGNYWLTSLGNGVYCMNNKYTIYKDKYRDKVKFAQKLNDCLFFSTTDNNLQYLRDGNVTKVFDYAGYKRKKFLVCHDPGHFIDTLNRYYSFYNEDGFVFENLMSGKIKKTKCQLLIGESWGSWRLIEGIKSILSNRNAIYIQRRDGIFQLNYPAAIGDKLLVRKIVDSLGFDRIFAMARDKTGDIWYATVRTMLKVHGSKGAAQSQFKDVTFKSFHFLGDNMIGFTHNNKLLACSNINSSNVQIDSGFHQNVIWEEFYDLDKNHILLTTNKLNMILALDTAGGRQKIALSAIEDPFVPVKTERICFDAANCYFFKDGAIISIPVSSLLAKPKPPQLFFDELRTGKAVYTIHDAIELPFNESQNITIHFSTLSLNSRFVYYQYSIAKAGAESWQDITSEQINLANTPYGNYTVKVRARTSTSGYSAPVSFSLVITRPFWATWWFISLAVLCVVVIAAIAIRRRLSSLLHKKEQEHDTRVQNMRSEYKALNALMNPHFIFNTLNNVQSLYNGNNRRVANKYLRIFADLIRQNMHNVAKELIPLQKEIDLVNNYLLLEKLRFETRLEYEINIEEGLDISEIMIPPLLIQPLVENSIKHGILQLDTDDGIIYVNLYERGDTLYIEVKDNGVGINDTADPENAQHQSFGLENIRKRIEQLSIIQDKQFTFSIANENDEAGVHQWTIVTITMPIIEEE